MLYGPKYKAKRVKLKNKMQVFNIYLRILTYTFKVYSSSLRMCTSIWVLI